MVYFKISNNKDQLFKAAHIVQTLKIWKTLGFRLSVLHTACDRAALMQISVIFVKTICLQSRHIYQTLDLAVKVNFWKHSHKASGYNISDFKGHVSSCKRVLLGRSHLFYMKSFHPSSVIYGSSK